MIIEWDVDDQTGENLQEDIECKFVTNIIFDFKNWSQKVEKIVQHQNHCLQYPPSPLPLPPPPPPPKKKVQLQVRLRVCLFYGSIAHVRKGVYIFAYQKIAMNQSTACSFVVGLVCFDLLF